jgi:hypothetical protein
MKALKESIINDDNRCKYQNDYIDYLISHMDFIEIREALRNYLHKEKGRYSNKFLENEIRRENPDLLSFSSWSKDEFATTLNEEKEGSYHA